MSYKEQLQCHILRLDKSTYIMMRYHLFSLKRALVFVRHYRIIILQLYNAVTESLPQLRIFKEMLVVYDVEDNGFIYFFHL